MLYEQIRMEHVRDAIVWDMLGSPYFMGDLAKRLPMRPINPLTPEFRNICIRNIKVSGANTFLIGNGIPESPFHDVVIENGEVSCEKIMPVMNDFADVTIRNFSIRSENGDINILGGKGLLMEDCTITVPSDTLYTNYKETSADNLRFENINNVVVIKRKMK